MFPSKVFDRILLTHMLSEMKYSGFVWRSQRDYGEIISIRGPIDGYAARKLEVATFVCKPRNHRMLI